MVETRKNDSYRYSTNPKDRARFRAEVRHILTSPVTPGEAKRAKEKWDHDLREQDIEFWTANANYGNRLWRAFSRWNLRRLRR